MLLFKLEKCELDMWNWNYEKYACTRILRLIVKVASQRHKFTNFIRETLLFATSLSGTVCISLEELITSIPRTREIDRRVSAFKITYFEHGIVILVIF